MSSNFGYDTCKYHIKVKLVYISLNLNILLLVISLLVEGDDVIQRDVYRVGQRACVPTSVMSPINTSLSGRSTAAFT